MRDFAAILIIVYALVGMLVTITFAVAPSTGWTFVESPQTSICYEKRSEMWGFLGGSSSMSPVDSSYCEDDSDAQ